MIRTYEAGIGIMIVLIALVQFVMLSAGRLGEQWDSTELDVEVKKALSGLESFGIQSAVEEYSKIRDPDLLRIPDSESIGYRILINGLPVDKTQPSDDTEVATADLRIDYLSSDAPTLVRSFWARLLRSDYVQQAGKTMDYESVDELADLIRGLMWNDDSGPVVEDRVSTLRENKNNDGGWGFILGKESDTFSTATAVRALAAWIVNQGGDPLADPDVSDGLSWLKNRVHADGGYGSRERIESSVDMTSHALLAYLEVGLDISDSWVAGARDFLLRSQKSDGSFPVNRRARGDPGSTAAAVEALMAVNASQSVIERAVSYLDVAMVTEGDFELRFTPLGGDGTYDASIGSGYIVDCSPRGHEFWGEHLDDSIIGIVGVEGDRDNMTVRLRIERDRLVLPENKQKITICFSHNMTPDDTDWWILNAGNPHTAGQGDRIDDPKFQQSMQGKYTMLTITGLVVPEEYDFFEESEDWLIAIVGDQDHPIKDNPGWGYLIGYWSPWLHMFEFTNILAWRAWSPRVNRVCLDVDQDWEFDDRRLTDGDSVWVDDHEWRLEMWENLTAINLTFRETVLNYTRWYYPQKYDLSSIPQSKSGLYHLGIISIVNKPAFSKDYTVVLRDSIWEGLYDEAYIFDGTSWACYPVGSVWEEDGTQWIVDIEGDFLVLTRKEPVVLSSLSGRNTTTLSVQGDFLTVDVDRHGPKEVWLNLLQDSEIVDRAVFDDSLDSAYREVFGTWAGLRETSRVYESLSLAERWLVAESAARSAHDLADVCQQTIKFNKAYNSVIEDMVSIEAWYKSGGGD